MQTAELTPARPDDTDRPDESTRPGRSSQRADGGYRPFDRVIVPVGGSAHELEIQLWAVQFASLHDVPVHAIHVRSDEPSTAPRDLFGYLEMLCDKREIPLTAEVHEGEVVDELCRELQARDLVVVGTERMTDGSLGASVVEGLIRGAPCPVQVLRLT